MPPPSRKPRKMAATQEDKSQSCGKKFLSVMVGHVGLLIIVCVYAVLGAYMLMDIESTYEDKVNVLKKLKYDQISDSKKYIVLDMWYQNTQNHTPATFKGLAYNNLRLFHDFVVTGVSSFNYDGEADTKVENWFFSNALLFTVTTMAAIGYGHISPNTFNGQMFCIFYGLVGVPLLLVFLANIGDALASSFRYVYSRGCCITCRMRRRVTELKKGGQLVSVFKDEVGDETYMPTDEVQVPITVNVCVLTVYLMLGGLIFSTWEGWEFHTAAYFSFITLSTIGFGDYVPGSSFKLTDSPMVSGLKMVVTISYSIFGMALLSMCINLIQEQIVAKFKWMAKEMGMSGEDEEDMAKSKYRKTEHEVTVTPPEKDGNHNFHVQNIEDRPIQKFQRRPQSSNKEKFTDLSDQ